MNQERVTRPEVPLSKSPVLDVTVWVTPVFVQVTVVPALTVIVPGLKPKSTMVTALPDVALAAGAAALACALGPATGDGADVAAAPLHAASANAAPTTTERSPILVAVRVGAT
jgi:hypothetical protein